MPRSSKRSREDQLELRRAQYRAADLADQDNALPRFDRRPAQAVNTPGLDLLTEWVRWLGEESGLPEALIKQALGGDHR